MLVILCVGVEHKPGVLLELFVVQELVYADPFCK
jgi:hypothetical protein